VSERSVPYFAYGSNLSTAVLRERCPSARQIDIGRVDGHRIGFTRRSIKRGGGVADLVPAATRAVWGALFELSDDDLAALDRCEGVPRAYRRDLWEIVRPNRSPSSAWVYVVTEKQTELQPSYGYWRLIVEGAREAGLPHDYVEELEALSHLGAV